MYPHGAIAASVLDEHVLQHNVVEHANPALIDLLAHRAGHLGRDILDRITPAWTPMTRRWLVFELSIAPQKRGPPGGQFLNTGTRFSRQRGRWVDDSHGTGLQRVSQKELDDRQPV